MELTKKPKNPVIVHGFPGFGLVGTITTEFLIRHCKCELIGKKWFEDQPAAIAIHKGRIINPIGIYYNEKYNMIIVHSIAAGQGAEWKIADFLEELAADVDASEFLSLEGVGSMENKDVPEIYYYASEKKHEERMKKAGLKPLSEGVIMGVTSALMLKTKRPMNALFAETHADFPDSKAAAELIKTLDKVLDLNIDPKPLYESAKRFEENFNKLIEQSQFNQQQIKKKQLNYVG